MGIEHRLHTADTTGWASIAALNRLPTSR
jgi:hypothetical protein